MNNVVKFKREIILVLLLGSGYLILRLAFLLHNPIFTDEAIYLRWAQIALQDPAWTFISLSDGKQPLFIWLVMPLLRIFSDPLMAGRVVSVMAGFASMIGVGLLSYILFKNKWIGFLTSLLYLIYPMAYVYDRLAIYDSLVGTFYIYGLLLALLLIKLRRLDITLLFGLVLGGGLLNKSSSMFILYLLPFTLLLFDWKQKKRGKELLKWVGLVTIAMTVAFGIESLLRLSPYYYIIAEKNAVFVVPLREWIQSPFIYIWGNLKGLTGWFFDYFTVVGVIVASLSFVVTRHFTREKVLLLVYFLAPFVALALFGRVIYPRYIFFMTLPLLPLVALSVSTLMQRVNRTYLKVFVGAALLAPMFFITFSLIRDYKTAPIPETDKQQLITSWPAGSGVKKTVAFFEKEAKKGPIFVATQGELGLLPYAFEIYLDNTPNITIEGYWPIEEKIPNEIIEKGKQMPTFVVFYQPCPSCMNIGVAPSTWPLETVWQQTNPDGSYYTVYKVKSS